MDLHEEIFERALALSRDTLSENDEAVLREMCQAAFYELSRRLREDVAVEDITEQFVRAAASLGMSLYVETGIDHVRSFSAGSVKISRRAASDIRASASSLRKQAELMLTGYLRDGGFAFRAVRV